MNGYRSSVAPAGDADGDGVPDFALAKRPVGLSETREVREGFSLDRIWIVSGKDGSRIRTLLPPRRATQFGRCLESIGDLDADGVPELAVAGVEGVWVFSGRTGEVLHDLGGPLAGLGVGSNLCGGGDVDGDGVGDLGVYRARSERDWDAQPGVVLLYSGRTGEALHVLTTAEDERWAGIGSEIRVRAKRLTPALAFVPDRDGDGAAEIALTAAVEHEESEDDAHEVIVVGSIDGAVLQRIALSRLARESPPWVLRALPDLDGDAAPDLALSVIHSYVLVLSGKSGNELHRHAWTGGCLMAEGSTLGVIGDQDGDGIVDYFVGANEDSIDCDEGMLLIHSGRNGRFLESIEVECTWGECELSSRCAPGYDACALGDVNEDGIMDLVVHVPRWCAVRLVSGGTFEVLARIDTRTLSEPSREEKR